MTLENMQLDNPIEYHECYISGVISLCGGRVYINSHYYNDYTYTITCRGYTYFPTIT